MSTALNDDGDGDQTYQVVVVPSVCNTPEAVIRYILSQFPQIVGDHFEAAIINWRYREELGSTNVGRGLAIPEVVGTFVNRSSVIVGKLAEPVEWPGAEEVRRVFLIVCQEQMSVLPLIKAAARYASSDRSN